MALSVLDWIVLSAYFLFVLVVGMSFARLAGRGMEDFFLAGRSLPWWLLGTSMVATTFSTDTPNLVTQLVRADGVAGNWVWWAFLITGMLTVFVFAPLWRRSELLTDLEFYEIRYSGRPAAFLRGFRAIYLGVLFNGIVIASVTLAAAKIGGALFGASKVLSVSVCAVVAVSYAAVAGFWGVVATDVLQFFLSLAGSVLAAVYAVSHPAVGGLLGLSDKLSSQLALIPPLSNTEAFVTILVVPLALQWWSVWYPASEPGGGGYLAQRMLAARNERHALLGTLWFNIAHYTLRPWPWILVALSSLILYPDLAAIQAALPGVDPALAGDDLAYPLMLRLLPAGVLGLMVASLAGAYMSTVDTHLNWGASYLVHDVYRRFFKPDADERHYVRVARGSTVFLMAGASGLALVLETAGETFSLILQIGAGTGLLFILRWLWWRVNAWSEIVAMAASFSVAVGLLILKRFGNAPEANLSLALGVAITTVCWLVTTWWTRPTDRATLEEFCRRVRPPLAGWKRVYLQAQAIPLSAKQGFLAWPVACLVVYAALFGTGALLFRNLALGMGSALLLALGVPVLIHLARRSLNETSTIAPAKN
ncbi:MAG: sodium:solute symporter family protein [Acidobacteriota bacterium]